MAGGAGAWRGAEPRPEAAESGAGLRGRRGCRGAGPPPGSARRRGLTGRRGRAEQVQTFPGVPGPGALRPGPVRPPAPRARAAPAPCAPRVRPHRDPDPRAQSRAGSSSPRGRIPGEGAVTPGLCRVALENRPGFLLSHIVKLENMLGRPRTRQRLPPSPGGWGAPLPPRVGGQGRWEGCRWVPEIQHSLMTGRKTPVVRAGPPGPRNGGRPEDPGVLPGVGAPCQPEHAAQPSAPKNPPFPEVGASGGKRLSSPCPGLSPL